MVKLSRTLLLGAHPDDESIFGMSDLLDPTQDVCVICFTNAKEAPRRAEFTAAMKAVGAQHVMLEYPDGPQFLWPTLNPSTDLLPLIQSFGSFDRVVSHDAGGEYGHPQHIRVHQIGKEVATLLGVPFFTFAERYRPECNKSAECEYVLGLYTFSQGIVQGFRNYHEMTEAQKKPLRFVSK